MKLRNKKTGEVIETDFELSVSVPDDEKFYGNNTYTEIKGYSSIKELSEDWEDYEEQCWYITSTGEVREGVLDVDWRDETRIGNYFKTKEEAEKAVEKLKAWKRLKDKGFKFKDWNCAVQELYFTVPDSFYDRPDMVGEAISDETTKDLDLLFRSEE